MCQYIIRDGALNCDERARQDVLMRAARMRHVGRPDLAERFDLIANEIGAMIRESTQ